MHQPDHITLDGATVTAARGTVFGPLTATSDRPVTVVHGPSGSGRTALLLSLAGRMRLTDGSVTVLGENHTGAMRRQSGIAGFAGIDELEPAVTVAATLRERLSWALPWYRRTPRIDDDIAAEIFTPAFGARSRSQSSASHPETAVRHPDTTELCRELTPLEDLLMRVSLAQLESPKLIVIDDFDAIRDPEGRRTAAARLARVATETPVVVATSDAGDIDLFTAAGETPAVIKL